MKSIVSASSKIIAAFTSGFHPQSEGYRAVRLPSLKATLMPGASTPAAKPESASQIP